jgi:hypothetical protein
VLILSVGLLLFFMLEMVRYALTELRLAQKSRREEGGMRQNKLIEWLLGLLSWMESFNSQR